MHVLLIVLLLVVAFPALRCIAGSLLTVIFWLIVAGAVLAMVGAISG
jgi:hypothetical protein